MNSKPHKLSYKISSFSSFTTPYYPENILINDPSNTNSRWTTITDNEQFIILEVEEPSIVTGIKFGKFSKLHVCNVKYLKVYSLFDYDDLLNEHFNNDNIQFNNDNINFININTEKNNLKCINNISINKNKSHINTTKRNTTKQIQTLSASLSNDSISETFLLKTISKSQIIITRRLKITPLGSWGMGSTFSFWYIELYGFKASFDVYDWNRRIIDFKVKRLVKKYLIKVGRNVLRSPESIIDSFLGIKSFSKLEQLKMFLQNKNYDNAIDLIREMTFNEYLKNSKYFGELIKIESKEDGDNEKNMNGKYKENKVITNKKENNISACNNKNINNIKNTPEGRAGHQLLFNKKTNKLILYGGWNGIKELGDIFEFDLKTQEWKFIGRIEERSCHNSFIYNNSFYSLGRYLVANDRKKINDRIQGNVIYKNLDFNDNTINNINEIDINRTPNETTDISTNNIRIPLFDEIYDHQIDIKDNDIYIVGGRCYKGNKSFYNGILKTNLESGETEMLINEEGDLNNTNNDTNNNYDNQTENKTNNGQFKFVGRSGHSLMIVNENELKLNAYDKIKEDILNIYGDNDGSIDNNRNDINKKINDNNINSKNPKDISDQDKQYPSSILYNFKNTLIITGGQKNKESFNEMIFFDTKENYIYLSVPLPIKNKKFIQRSILICDEIFSIFCINASDGYEGECDSNDSVINLTARNDASVNGMHNSDFSHSRFFSFSLKTFKWREIEIEPAFVPRSSFQFLYAGYFYIYGGLNRQRMDDFYQLRLRKESDDDIRKKLYLKVYQLRISEIIKGELNDKGKDDKNKFKEEKNNFDENNNKNRIKALNYLKSIKNNISDTDYKRSCVDLLTNNFDYSIEDVLNEVSKYLDEKIPDESLEDYVE